MSMGAQLYAELRLFAPWLLMRWPKSWIGTCGCRVQSINWEGDEAANRGSTQPAPFAVALATLLQHWGISRGFPDRTFGGRITRQHIWPGRPMRRVWRLPAAG